MSASFKTAETTMAGLVSGIFRSTLKMAVNKNYPLKRILYFRSKGFDIISIGTDV